MVDKYEMSYEITSMFRDINCMIHQRHHDLAEEFKLSVDQFHLLVYIIDHEKDLSIGRLANVFNLAPNTMSEKLSRIEEKGLICRKKDEKDKRIHRIMLTDKGRRMIEKIRYKARKEYVVNALSKIEDADLLSLHTSLKETLKHMQEE